MRSTRQQARYAGLLYILMCVTGLPGLLLIPKALIVHGDDWRPYFDKLKPFLKVAYVKDAKREGRWVPFGQGDVGKTGYFTLLKQTGYHAPFSMHLEYDWTDKGASKNRAALVKALKESAQVLKRWVAEA